MKRDKKSRDNYSIAVLSICLLWSSTVICAPALDDSEPDADSSLQSEDEQQAGSAPTSAQSGPGSFKVDELAATRALERSLIRSDALLLAKGQIEIGFDFSLQFDEFISPLLVDFQSGETENAPLDSTGLGESRATVANKGLGLSFKVGLPLDTQIELSLPLKAERIEVSTQFDGTELQSFHEQENGVGDLQVSILKTLIREKGRRPDIILRITVDPDTGGSRKKGIDFGSGTNEYTLGVAATKRQDPLVFNYGISHTVSQSSEDFQSGAVTQVYSALYLAASPYTSLSFAFNKTIVGEAERQDVRIAGSDLMLGALSLGFSSTVGRNWFLSGAISAGLNESANDYALSFGISRRLSIY